MHRKSALLLLVAGLVVAVRPTVSQAKRYWFQWHSSRVWKLCRSDIQGGGAGEPCGWLGIPEVGLAQMVLEGANKDRLSLHPCAERVGSSTLIMAHRDTHFMGLEELGVGDAMEWEERGGYLTLFECEEIFIVEKGEARALIEKYVEKERLILLTCYPFQFVGSAPKRFVAVARPVNAEL